MPGEFRDARVRRPFNFAFNFQVINRELFYNQHKRMVRAPRGLPNEQELALLHPLRSQVPNEVFMTA
ncbi:MAG: hypothetical protein JOZ94_09015 [Xanthobacteraceae bacterium]|nr:hypothetical protein [Xanthobacteraceae bacterium]